MKLTGTASTRVTLALDIIRKIEQGPLAGYHELGAIKHQIDLSDTITIEDALRTTLECDNSAVPVDERNVCLQAVSCIKKEYGIDRHVRIQLAKRIPVMGGLAGGSADAAATIALVSELWGLNLTRERLAAIGHLIGMDVPFYFYGKTAFDNEISGRLEPIATSLTFNFVLACPEFGVSTKEAYGAVDYSRIGRQIQLTESLRTALRGNDLKSVYRSMHNDFECTVFARHQRLQVIRQELLDAGCLSAMMTGSGSTIIGIAESESAAKVVQKKLSCASILARSL